MAPFMMPKKNQVKNMFKSVEGSSSLAPAQSSQAQSSSSSSDEVSSQPVIPSASSHGISSQLAKHRAREKVDPDWLVDVIDTHQVVTVRLKLRMSITWTMDCV